MILNLNHGNLKTIFFEKCEELIDEHDTEVEWEKRKKEGVTAEQINEELREQIRIAKMKLAKKKENKE